MINTERQAEIAVSMLATPEPGDALAVSMAPIKLRETAKAIAWARDFAGSVKADRTMTPAAQNVKVAKAVQARYAGLHGQLEALENDIITDMEQVVSRMRAAEQVPHDQKDIASEIRRHALSMDDRQREAWLNARVAAKDVLSIQALASAPPYLSGVREGALKQAASHLHDPADQARLERYLTNQNLVKNTRDLLRKDEKQYWTDDVANLIEAAKRAAA